MARSRGNAGQVHFRQRLQPLDVLQDDPARADRL
jgi:hypothetical protein